MVKTTKLITTVAPYFNKEPVTLNVIARLLRESGLIASGKAGAGADLSIKDAAALLVGFIVPGPARGVAEAVDDFMALPFSDVVGDFMALHPSEENEESRMLPRLTEQTSFGGAIEWLIAEASEIGSMYNAMYYQGANAALRDRPLGTAGSPLELWIEVRSDRSASISLAARGFDPRKLLDLLIYVPERHAAGSPNHIQTGRIDLAPVLALHRLFVPEDDYPTQTIVVVHDTETA